MKEMDVDQYNFMENIKQATYLWLFLDYDGTLADFAPTPDDVFPNTELIELITDLSQHPQFRTAIVSGRRLKHIQTLLPVEGIWLAGTYGIEIQSPKGELIHQASFEEIRPTIKTIKKIWEDILNKQTGFYLEDKGWSLAIHAKDASNSEALEILTTARNKAINDIECSTFRILGGDRFLEIAPNEANKANAVNYLLGRYQRTGSYSIYIGDDDKDEEAFRVIKNNGGTAILVSTESRKSLADFRIDNPQSVRHWLRELAANL
jgi:trehalose 6-phosphate phosphatase